MRPAAAAGLALLLAACHTAPTSAPPPAAPTAAAAPSAPGAAGTRYVVDAGQSDVRLFVRREGPAAALGHNHVIAVRGLRGSVQLADAPEQARIELHFPVAELSIDEPDMRAAAGTDYQSVVNDAARTGTRNNMLGEQQLQSARYPEISISSGAVTATGADAVLVELQLQVRDHRSTVQVPVRWRHDSELLQADSEFTLQQSALGLTPLSVAMGALRVADAIEVRCRIVAHRAAAVPVTH
jgi:polyisoprenoid-binding protein YceI